MKENIKKYALYLHCKWSFFATTLVHERESYGHARTLTNTVLHLFTFAIYSVAGKSCSFALLTRSILVIDIIYSEERGNNDAWFCGANLQSELLYSKIGPSKYFSRVLKRPMNFMFLCCVPLNSNRFGCKRFPKNSKVVK